MHGEKSKTTPSLCAECGERHEAFHLSQKERRQKIKDDRVRSGHDPAGCKVPAGAIANSPRSLTGMPGSVSHSMKPGDKCPKGLRRNSGRSIKRTRLSVVTQLKVGSLSHLLNPATDGEEIGTNTHPAFRRNTGRHEFKDVKRTWETLTPGWL